MKFKVGNYYLNNNFENCLFGKPYDFKISYISENLFKIEGKEGIYSVENNKLYENNKLLFENFYIVFINSSPLIKAIIQEDFEEAERLIKNKEIYPYNVYASSHSTSLMLLISLSNINLIEMLLDSNLVEDRNFTDTFGCTAFLYAVLYSQINIVELLISKNFTSDPNLSNSLKMTPFLVSVSNLLTAQKEIEEYKEKKDIVKLLISNNLVGDVNIKRFGSNLFEKLCETEDKELIQMMIENNLHTDINTNISENVKKILQELNFNKKY